MAPDEISHYRIVGLLGRGAMGEVYRAVDQRLGREVALKMLPRDVEGDADWQTRLLREAQAASALNHPGIVTLFDLETADGRSFLVMELVAGEPFSELAKRGVSWRRAATLVIGAAEALAAAHALGILHRDIKSDNLMVTPAGQVKVLDFGLAKLRADVAAHAGGEVPGGEVPGGEVPGGEVPGTLQEVPGTLPGTSQVPELPDVAIAETLPPPASSSQPTWRPASALSSDLTQAGQMVGTPAYMAPESYDGVTDARSEVFALGVVLHELLVGRRPFDRGNAFATMAAIKLDEPEPPSKAAPSRAIPARLDRIVARALAKDPAARFASMSELAQALRSAAAPRAWKPWAAAAVAGGIALWGGWHLLAPSQTGPRPPTLEVTASRRLTMEPGCEEYPHFTPDGRHVIYDGVIAGDTELQQVTLDGGERLRVTNSHGWDYGAAVSPDGRRLAYVHEGASGRTLKVISTGAPAGTPVDLGAISGYASWDRDGALLLGDPGGRILRRELSAGDAPSITRETVLGQLPPGARAYHVAQVGDHGHALLWWTSSGADATVLGELDGKGSLRVVEQELTDYEGGLAPSPDGRGYFVTRRGATTGNQLLWRRWGGGAAIVVPGGISPRAGVDVARDGKRLVFSTCTDRQYVARLGRGAAPTIISRGEWQDAYPEVIDTGHLLITSDRLGHQQGWLMGLDGSDARAVTPPDSHGAAPSRDGRWVVYAADGGGGGLAVVAIDGGAPRRLTDDASDTAPMFSRHGDQVVFERTTGGQAHVHVVAISGGPARMLAAGSQPAASPVDDRVVFIAPADAGGASLVMLTDTAGAPPRAVPGLTAAAWQRPRFSRDGTRLLLLRGYQEVVEVTLDGSAAPEVVWSATTDSVLAADFAPDGGVIAALADYDGDVWLAEGRFAPP